MANQTHSEQRPNHTTGRRRFIRFGSVFTLTPGESSLSEETAAALEPPLAEARPSLKGRVQAIVERRRFGNRNER